jgi:hypothetical protein
MATGTLTYTGPYHHQYHHQQVLGANQHHQQYHLGAQQPSSSPLSAGGDAVDGEVHQHGFGGPLAAISRSLSHQLVYAPHQQHQLGGQEEADDLGQLQMQQGAVHHRASPTNGASAPLPHPLLQYSSQISVDSGSSPFSASSPAPSPHGLLHLHLQQHHHQHHSDLGSHDHVVMGSVVGADPECSSASSASSTSPGAIRKAPGTPPSPLSPSPHIVVNKASAAAERPTVVSLTT